MVFAIVGQGFFGLYFKGLLEKTEVGVGDRHLLY